MIDNHNLDAGEIAYFKGETVTMPTDGTVENGDAVTLNANGNDPEASQAAVGNEVIGTCLPSNLNGHDNHRSINIAGLVVKVRLTDHSDGTSGYPAVSDTLVPGASGDFQVGSGDYDTEPVLLKVTDEDGSGNPTHGLAMFR